MIDIQYLIIVDLLLRGFYAFPLFIIELGLCFVLLRHLRKSYLLIVISLINIFIAYYFYWQTYQLYGMPGTGIFDSYTAPNDQIVSSIVGVFIFILTTSSLYFALIIRKLFNQPLKK